VKNLLTGGQRFSTSENNEPEVTSTLLRNTLNVYVFAYSEGQGRRVCTTTKMQSLFRSEI